VFGALQATHGFSNSIEFMESLGNFIETSPTSFTLQIPHWEAFMLDGVGFIRPHIGYFNRFA
jgi:hypothetical protein